MIQLTHSRYWIGILFLVITGCGSNVPNQTVSPTPETMSSAMPFDAKNSPQKKIFWAVNNPTLPNGMAHNEFLAMNKLFAEEVYKKYYKIWRTIIDAPTWQEADKQAKEYLRMTENHYFAFFIQQEVASSMLRSFFIYTAPTPESINAMTFYLNILQKHRYYGEVNLYTQILPKLKGYWSKSQIQEIANHCVQRYNERWQKNLSAESYFASQAERSVIQSLSTHSNSEQSSGLQKFKEDFIAGLPSKLASYRKLDDIKWFRPQDENVVVLILIAE
jgi:hypothetical protein